MLIIHDNRLPEEAISNLQKQGECLSFHTKGITHEAIAGHPDVFFCPVNGKVIVAPNIPDTYMDFLSGKRIPFVLGEKAIDNNKYNATSYNVVISDKYVIHNSKFTDVSVLDETKDKIFIHVSQGFTRCSLMPLKEDCFLTSDKGIEKKLLENGLECYYFSPDDIVLSGFPYGFIGGSMGQYRNMVFIIGRLKYHSQGDKIECLFKRLNYEVVELYNGPLFDGGSLFFIDTE